MPLTCRQLRQRGHSRCVQPRCRLVVSAGLWNGTVKRQGKERLRQIVSTTSFGATASDSIRQEVNELVNKMVKTPSTVGQLGGDWQLLYTTENSVHKLINAAARFNITITDIGQSIDSSTQRVTNYIEVAEGKAGIQASAPYKNTSARRISYTFDRAQLKVLGLTLSFKPRGGGWTEAVYLDTDMRVMRNSQADTLVFQRRD